MLLRKIKQSEFYQITQTYYVWLAYILLIFLGTNAYSSLDLIQRYQFPALDMVLTYALPAFIINVETFILGIFMAFIQKSLTKVFEFDISAIFRILLIVGFLLAWVNLFLTVFDKAIF